jgi:LmbE family N-acetylglucosaminyl deacetylase
MTAAPQPLAMPARALSIGAHPDDAEFGAGGTLAQWSAAGCEVTMLVVTDGSKGTWDPALNPEQLVAARHAEQRAAADELGATEVVMLGAVDGELEPSVDLRRELTSWIRRLRPDVVLTHDPWKRYMLHSDHRVTGFAAVDAVVAARDHLFFPEQLTGGVEKHRPGALLLWAADEPDHFEDIAATFDRKLTALLRHSSQTQTTMGDALTSDVARRAFEDRIREWAAQQGEPAGLPLAESFKRLTP